MRLAQSLILSAAALHAASVASGQPALGQLEQRLQSNNPQAGPGTPAAAADGFLGAALEDEGVGRGIRVTSLRQGGPADKGGLKVDDVITAINGRPVKAVDDYDNIKGPPGMTLRMTVDRGGRPESLTVTLERRPPSADANVGEASPAPALSPPATSPAPPSLSPPTGARPPIASPAPSAAESSPRISGIRAAPLDLPPPPPTDGGTPPRASGSGTGGASLGITVEPFMGQDIAAPGVPVRRGAVITNVRPGSPAELAGLSRGGVIVGIDGKLVTTSDDLVSVIRNARPGQDVELRFYVGETLSQKTVRLAAAGASTSASLAGPEATPRRPGASFPPGGPPVARPAVSPTDAAPSTAGSATRPLINRVERNPDNFRPPTAGNDRFGPSTVYNPQDIAELRKSVAELTAAIGSLEERLKAIESRQGGSSSVPASPSGTQPPTIPGSGPGLGSPAGDLPSPPAPFGRGPG
jgi:hypothetical protein